MSGDDPRSRVTASLVPPDRASARDLVAAVVDDRTPATVYADLQYTRLASRWRNTMLGHRAWDGFFSEKSNDEAAARFF